MDNESTNSQTNEQFSGQRNNVASIQYDTALIDQQAEEIRKEIEENSPIVSDILPIDLLEFEFSGHEAFLNKIQVSILFGMH